MKKEEIMCTIANKFMRLSQTLNSEDKLKSSDLSFEKLCRRLHVSPSSMDEYIQEELGLSGEELVLKLYLDPMKDSSIKA